MLVARLSNRQRSGQLLALIQLTIRYYNDYPGGVGRSDGGTPDGDSRPAAFKVQYLLMLIQEQVIGANRKSVAAGSSADTCRVSSRSPRISAVSLNSKALPGRKST